MEFVEEISLVDRVQGRPSFSNDTVCIDAHERILKESERLEKQSAAEKRKKMLLRKNLPLQLRGLHKMLHWKATNAWWR